MKLTVLGTGTIAFSAQRSCSSYYVEAGSARMLMDCGSGTTRRLAELAIPWNDISHVALTHFHIDHHGDLPTLVFAWKYGILPPRTEPIVIIGPAGTADLLARLAAAYGEWLRTPDFPLTVREVAPGETMELSSRVRLSAHKVPHTAESVAYSIERAGRRIVYTGDTGPDDGLAHWAFGCDLLLCECSLPTPMAIPEHLTPEQCGALAARAQPTHLVLTHFYPPVERVDIRAAIATQFAGPVTLARDGWHFEFEDE